MADEVTEDGFPKIMGKHNLTTLWVSEIENGRWQVLCLDHRNRRGRGEADAFDDALDHAIKSMKQKRQP